MGAESVEPNISILYVGHGNCTVVSATEAVILDAGRRSTLVEFLKNVHLPWLVKFGSEPKDNVGTKVANSIADGTTHYQRYPQ